MSADLLSMGLSARQADWLLRQSPITGHGGEPVIEAERVEDLLPAMPQDGEEEEGDL